MGQKKQRLEAFLEAHPTCCFCGGKTPATTQDHVPARIFFPLKRRPEGLEFPACERCNNVTSQHEQICALLARLFPDLAPGDEMREAQKLIRAIRNNHPGLVESLFGPPGLYPAGSFLISDDRHAIFLQDERLTTSVYACGRKLALALHYKHTGRILTEDGQILIHWKTNYDALKGDFPHDVAAELGEPQYLSQGKWDASDTFWYQVRTTDDGNISMIIARFRLSLCIFAITTMNPAELGIDATERKGRAYGPFAPDNYDLTEFSV